MRAVPADMGQIWRSGDYTGANQPICRATIQHGGMQLETVSFDQKSLDPVTGKTVTKKGSDTYANFIFGAEAIPKELPNVKSCSWSRSIEQDFATMTLTLYNTAPMPIGMTPDRDVDMPGYYTFNRGQTSYANRWGQTPNEWEGLLAPDNIIRTFEGYGCNPDFIPEKDPALVQTGVWMIDEVTYEHSGLITITCRDIGRILGDQICFPPVVPPDFYPLQFAASNKPVGFIGPVTHTYSVDSGGNYDPKHPPYAWHGPTTAPGIGAVTAGDKSIHVTWTAPSVSLPAPTDGHPANPSHVPPIAKANPTYGYKIVAYQLVVDGVRLPTRYPASARSADVPSYEIMNGNFYSVGVVCIYEEMLTAAGVKFFKTNVLHQEVSSESVRQFARPGYPGICKVQPDSIQINVNGAGELTPNMVTFVPQGDASFTDWTMIAYRPGVHSGPGAPVLPGKHVYNVTTHDDVPFVEIDTTEDGLGDMRTWNFLVYGRHATVDPGFNTGRMSSQDAIERALNRIGKVGSGDAHFSQFGGTFYAPPVDGAPPHEPPPTKGATVTVNSTVNVPLKPVKVGIKYRDSSNTYYTGNDGSVYGHHPDDAFDGSDSSYFLSIGNARNDQGYSYEWIEGAVGGETLTQVKFKTKKTGYFVWVSVYAKGTWVRHNASDVIPYDPHNPESHNAGNIPFCETLQQVTSESEQTVTFRTPIPGVTRVRLTFHNLQDFGIGLPYRAACREITCYGTSGGGTSTTSVTEKIGPTQDDDSPDIVKTYTDYTPAHIEPGAGETPGLYNDYTDIVKLLCAWAGFFWPDHASEYYSDGDYRQWDFGIGPYGLANVDPVLGEDSGRVWGDFQNTGTAGPALLPITQWDKKTLMDGISFIRDIIGFIFYIDEQGAVVWRRPNIFGLGNFIGNVAANAGRVDAIIEIDERTTLVGLRAKLSSRNVRERIFIATVDGQTGALAQGYNPNPVGLRRVGGWTDQHFASEEECQVMADLIALRQLFTYRTDTVTIPAYPAIQVDDQVRIFEQVTSEGYVHYIKGISSHLDHETGEWMYDLDTHWLGERPFDLWVFNPEELSEETQVYLSAIAVPGSQPLPTGVVV